MQVPNKDRASNRFYQESSVVRSDSRRCRYPARSTPMSYRRAIQDHKDAGAKKRPSRQRVLWRILCQQGCKRPVKIVPATGYIKSPVPYGVTRGAAVILQDPSQHHMNGTARSQEYVSAVTLVKLLLLRLLSRHQLLTQIFHSVIITIIS